MLGPFYSRLWRLSFCSPVISTLGNRQRTEADIQTE